MSKKSRLEYVEAIRDRYHRASKKEKSKILDEFCQVVGLHRKSAIRLLNRKTPSVHTTGSKPGRKA